MGSGIFKDNAMKYFEAGIPVIPLHEKAPIIKGWTVWCEREQTYEEVEALIEEFPNANIGSPLGRWAMALDIDTDDENVLRAAPYSPIRRRGKKGFVSLFAPNSIENIPQAGYPFEILNTFRQIVLPPSIHPETGEPYHWVGEEDVWNRGDLPEFQRESVAVLQRVCEQNDIRSKERKMHESGTHSVMLTDIGRNNRLVKIAYAMACDDTPVLEAEKRLLILDKKENPVPWFSDVSEPHRGRDPAGSARRMYERAMKAALKKGHVIRTVVGELEVNLVKRPKSEYPKARGLMRLFVEYCDSVSNGAQDALGLGGAVSLMSVLCANRFRTQAGSFDVRPNLFVLNIAHSGFGKETPQRTLDELLANTSLLGSTTYKSGTSIVMSLPEQQERLDVIDECSALLRSMGGREDYKSEIVEVLSSLYSKSNSRYLGMASRAEGANFGAAWNPSVSILGSTTPAGFRSSVSQEMASKGLLPRFLLFWQKEVGAFKATFDKELADSLLSQCQRMVRAILAVEKPEHADSAQLNLVAEDDEKTKRYEPHLVPMTPAAEKTWLSIAERYYNEGAKDPESFESAFKNRFGQHVAKLAMLDALSLGLAEINVDSIEWAHSLVERQWAVSKELYELASAENQGHKDLIRVKKVIADAGALTKSEFSRRTQWLNKIQRDMIMHSLLESEFCEVIDHKETAGAQRTVKKIVLKTQFN